MTDDLEGRLEPETLELECTHYPGQPVLQKSCTRCTPVNVDSDFYGSNSGLVFPVREPVLPPPPTVSAFVIFASKEAVELKGNLQSLSFGHEGWLCSLSTESKDIPAIVLKAAKEAVVSVRVVLADGSLELLTNIDCTASFSYGSASFTVTSDEARYV